MKLDKNVQTILTVAGVGAAAFIGYQAYKRWRTNKDLRDRLNQYAAAQAGYSVTLPSGEVANTTINLATTAAVIYDSFYNNDLLSWTEDETRAVNELKKVPKQLIPQLEQTYATLYSKDLRADLVKYLDSDEYEKISYLFN